MAFDEFQRYRSSLSKTLKKHKTFTGRNLIQFQKAERIDVRYELENQEKDGEHSIHKAGSENVSLGPN